MSTLANPDKSHSEKLSALEETLFCYSSTDPIKFYCIVSPSTTDNKTYDVELTGLSVTLSDGQESRLSPGASFETSSIEWKVLRSLLHKDINHILGSVINHTKNHIQTKGDDEEILETTHFNVMINHNNTMIDLSEYHSKYLKFLSTPDDEKIGIAAAYILEAMAYDADMNITCFSHAKADIINNNLKLQDQLHRHQQAIDSLRKECETSAAELEARMTEISTSNLTIQQKQDELAVLKAQLSEMESKIESVEDNIDDASLKTEEIDNQIKEVNNQIVNEISSQKESSDNEVSRKQLLLSNTQSDVTLLSTQLTDLEEELKELQQSSTHSQSKSAQLNLLQIEINKVTEEHAFKQDLIKQTEKELENALARSNTIQYVQTLTAKLNDKSANLKSLVAELEDLARENENTDKADIALAATINEHKKRVQELNSQLAAAASALDTANNNHTNLKQQLEEHNSKLQQKQKVHNQYVSEHQYSANVLKKKNDKLAELIASREAIQKAHNENLAALKAIEDTHEEQLKLKAEHENNIKKLVADIDYLSKESAANAIPQDKLDASAAHLEQVTKLATEAHRQYEESRDKLLKIKSEVVATSETLTSYDTISSLHSSLSSHVKKFKQLTSHINHHFHSTSPSHDE